MQAKEECLAAQRMLLKLARCLGADTGWLQPICIESPEGGKINIYLHSTGDACPDAMRRYEALSCGIHAAVYIPERGTLLPSLGLLNTIRRPKTYARLDRKSAILFTYGRDVFREGVLELRTPPSGCPNIVVVLDEHGEPIGWGRLRRTRSNPIIENLLDVGWYLRSGV